MPETTPLCCDMRDAAEVAACNCPCHEHHGREITFFPPPARDREGMSEWQKWPSNLPLEDQVERLAAILLADFEWSFDRSEGAIEKAARILYDLARAHERAYNEAVRLGYITEGEEAVEPCPECGSKTAECLEFCDCGWCAEGRNSNPPKNGPEVQHIDGSACGQ